MDNLSGSVERFFKHIMIFLTLIAVTVVGVPALVVLFQQPGINNNLASVVPTRPQSPYNLSKPKVNSSGEVDPSNLVTLGWTVGTDSRVTTYNKLQIVSPLYATINDSYNVNFTSSRAVISHLQSQGKKVWGRLTLGSQTDAATHQFLTNPSAWNQVIQTITDHAQKDNLDGINLDIEQIAMSDRMAFSQFVMNLSQQITKSHITLSIDIQPEPTDSTAALLLFNQKLCKYSDYIVFMGYDQHWSTDPVPGPVTSLQWLEKNTKQLIQTGITPQKLIIGLPSYTRIWEVDQNGNTVTSMALANQYVSTLMQQKNRHETWDPKQAVYNVAYTKNGKTYKVWLTNDRSLQVYLDLIEKFHMAGVAIWNLDMMPSNEWNQLINQI